MPIAPTVSYGAFSPLALSEDEEVRNQARGLAIDQRQESRILAQAKDSWDRLKRWMNEVNRKGEARTYYAAEMVALAPPQRAGFLPLDRLQVDVARHEHLFNPDPLASRKRDPGVVFHATTDFREAVANFDLTPFVEAYVRRLSQEVPEYVWRVGGRFYDRSLGLKFDPEARAFEPRRYPVPKQVVDAFGAISSILVQECGICGKSDDRVVAQPSDKTRYAHRECYAQGAQAGPAGPGDAPKA
ncbi:MAG TPA: hypothetical protein VHH36_08435 [Candidatus Thermoplasmatota archaeon]|nr:hypothetical protein [Candidatus Thermoplasmatota archaeon]